MLLKNVAYGGLSRGGCPIPHTTFPAYFLEFISCIPNKSHLKSSISHIISKPSNPPYQKNQGQNPAYQKKWKTNPAFAFFIWAPKCSVIYSPQLFTDYKEAKGIHLSPFWKCCLAKGNPFIFHSNPAFKSGKVAILHTS